MFHERKRYLSVGGINGKKLTLQDDTIYVTITCKKHEGASIQYLNTYSNERPHIYHTDTCQKQFNTTHHLSQYIAFNRYRPIKTVSKFNS